jgi:hypothetical protein
LSTGVVVDAAAAVALVAPLAGVFAPVAGRNRATAERVAGFASLLAVVVWAGLLVAAAAPSIGRYQPDALALAAAAGAALLAGRRLPPRHSPATPVGVAAVAVAVALAAGVVDGPTELATAAAAATAIAAAAVLVAVVIAAGRLPALIPLVPAVLLVGLRAGAAAPVGPDTTAAVAAAVLAGAGVAVALTRRGATAPSRAGAAVAVALGVVAIAVGLGPVPGLAAAAALLAAAAVLAVAAGPLVGAVAALPGAAAALTTVVDAGTGPVAARVVVGAAVVAVVVVVALLARRDAPGAAAAGPIGIDAATVVAGILATWLVLAPGAWAWAGDAGDGLRAWDQGAAVAATVGIGALAVRRARALADVLGAPAPPPARPSRPAPAASAARPGTMGGLARPGLVRRARP